MTADSEDRLRLPVYRALLRPNLLLGCERELFLTTGLITVILVVVAMDLIAGIAGMGLWGAGVAGLRAMAKADPVLSRVYVRHIRYRDFYPAHATPFAPGARHARG